MLALLGFLVAWCVFFNLPWFPAYERGLFTGIGLILAAWWAAWVLWVVSGLGFRLNGIWAEDLVIEESRNHAHARALVASYKLGGRDIDGVLITPAAVYAVEVKWKLKPLRLAEWRGMSAQLARDVRALRAELSGLGVPDHLVRGLLVICGPGSDNLASRIIGEGDSRIRVLAGDDVDLWLDGQNRGPMGVDFAESVAAELESRAAEADKALDLGLPMRWLARAR